MVNQWDLLPHIKDWRPRPIYPMPQRYRNHGQKNSLCPYSYHGSMHYAVVTTKPHHTWERHYPLKFMRCHIGAGKLHCTPEWKETTQYLLLQVRPLKMHYTRNGTCVIERGEKMGDLVWHIPPPVYHLTLTAWPPPASMHNMPTRSSS